MDMSNLHPSTPSPSDSNEEGSEERMKEASSTEKAGYMDTDGNPYRLTSDREADSVERVEETSMTGNVDHDIIIRDSGLAWIPFEEFKEVEFAARGGFSSIYKATWKDDAAYTDEYALKCIEGSNEQFKKFIAEAILHGKLRLKGFKYIVRLYGITRQPETGNYMMVMEWCKKGDLRQNLNECITYHDVYLKVANICIGLSTIHKAGLCHKDLHLGNILIGFFSSPSIGDLGLCGPVNKESDQVVGVLPYIAPEVLNGQPYTQAADIYSLGIIIWSLLVHQQPFCDQDFTDTQFYWDIYHGKRPDIPNWVPHWLTELILNCWQSNLSLRPSAEDIYDLFDEMDDINGVSNHGTLASDESTQVSNHPSAIYYSRVYPTISQLCYK